MSRRLVVIGSSLVALAAGLFFLWSWISADRSVTETAEESFVQDPPTLLGRGDFKKPATPEEEVFKRQGKFIYAQEGAAAKLSKVDMEAYLTRHGRTNALLSLAFLMTDDPAYLDEAIQSSDPRSALVLKMTHFPFKTEPWEREKLRALLGEDDLIPDLIDLWTDQKKNIKLSLERLASIDWTKTSSDPLAEILPWKLRLFAEMGEMPLREAFSEIDRWGGDGLSKARNSIAAEIHKEASQLSAPVSLESQKSLELLNLTDRSFELDLESARDLIWIATKLAEGASSSQLLVEVVRAKESNLTYFTTAANHNIRGIWEEPQTGSLGAQLYQDAAEFKGLMMLKQTVLPTLSDEALRPWLDRIAVEGEAGLWRELSERNEYKSQYELERRSAYFMLMWLYDGS